MFPIYCPTIRKNLNILIFTKWYGRKYFHILRQANNKKSIIYVLKSGSKCISTYRHSERKVMNVSYLLPDRMKDSKYIEIHVMDAVWINISCKFIFHDNQKRIKKDNMWQ